MYKTILPALIFSSTTLATPQVFFVDHSYKLSAGVGYSHFKNRSDQTLVISPYITDLLTNSAQHYNPNYTISAKQELAFNPSLVNTVFFGPALYFQKVSHSGNVWELFSPEFYNYNYSFKSNIIDLVFEGDFYFNPVMYQIKPFLTAGLGFGVANLHYNDYATFDIPVNTERHREVGQTKAVYEIGAGLAIPVRDHWEMNVRYSYLQMGIGTIPRLYPLDLNLNSNNIVLSLTYSII